MSTRSILAFVALALAPACGGSSTSGTVVIEDDPVDDTVAEGHARGDALADQTFDELVGADYDLQLAMTASILASLNDGEVNEADFAAQVVVDDDVFAFANDMIIDHEDANAELDSVVRFYGVGYAPSFTADDLAAQSSADIGVIRGSADPDFDYIEIQVVNHAAAQVLLDELYSIVGDGEMGDYIQSTMDMVDDHLAGAEGILATFY